MNYKLMWMALRHALIDQSHDDPSNPFYPAVILLMSGMEWYSQLEEKAKKGKQPGETEE